MRTLEKSCVLILKMKFLFVFRNICLLSFLDLFLFMDMRKRNPIRAVFMCVCVHVRSTTETLFKWILFKFYFCFVLMGSVFLLRNEYTFLYYI